MLTPPSCPSAGLWLGGIQALSPENLAACSITHVVSVANGPPPQLPAGAAAGGHLCIDLEDVEGANLLKHLPRAVEFVEAALSGGGGRVLVHCAQGVSRSAAVRLRGRPPGRCTAPVCSFFLPGRCMYVCARGGAPHALGARGSRGRLPKRTERACCLAWCRSRQPTSCPLRAWGPGRRWSSCGPRARPPRPTRVRPPAGGAHPTAVAAEGSSRLGRARHLPGLSTLPGTSPCARLAVWPGARGQPPGTTSRPPGPTPAHSTVTHKVHHHHHPPITTHTALTPRYQRQMPPPLPRVRRLPLPAGAVRGHGVPPGCLPPGLPPLPAGPPGGAVGGDRHGGCR
jgi:hypothetical protein